MIHTQHAFPLSLLGLVAIVFIWSGMGPYDRATWWMEVAPALIALPILLYTYKSFRLTDLVYGLIAIHAIILMIGGHYTYALVPLFDWLKEALGTARNSYDGVGHFAQGFIPAMVARELLIRTSPLRSGKWLFTLIVLGCLGIAGTYELIEWIAALALGQGADEFLGTQDDPWDTQKDIALAGIGAVCALISLSGWHDRQLARLA